MRLTALALFVTFALSALAQENRPRPRVMPADPRVQQDAPPVNPVDDSALDDARKEVKDALPQLRHMLNQLERLQAQSGTCAEQVPVALKPRYAEQMPALKGTLNETETVLRQVEREPMEPESLARAALLVDSARTITLRWAALLPRCKALQEFATEQVSLPLDETDPVIVMRTALAQLAAIRDRQVKQLRLMLEGAGNRVQGQ